MTRHPAFAIATLLLAGLCAHSQTAHAAQSYDNCAGTISTLPATISTQGVWCMKANLATAITSGAAILITTNNVTIDCNDFKLGGLAAGDASHAVGIYASNRQNATIRHCNIRGFRDGISLNTGSGNLIEDNRLDNNLEHGILVTGSDNTVRRNFVFDTGGGTDVNSPTAIQAYADVIENTVSGVFGTTATVQPYGIYAMAPSSEVSRNRVRGLVPAGAGSAYGIAATGGWSTLADNRVSNTGNTSGVGIYVVASYCIDNTVWKYTTTETGCVAP